MEAVSNIQSTNKVAEVALESSAAEGSPAEAVAQLNAALEAKDPGALKELLTPDFRESVDENGGAGGYNELISYWGDSRFGSVISEDGDTAKIQLKLSPELLKDVKAQIAEMEAFGPAFGYPVPKLEDFQSATLEKVDGKWLLTDE